MTTVNYSWTLPTVGASTNTWGTLLNAVLTDIDAKMFARTGGTISGNVSVTGDLSVSGSGGIRNTYTSAAYSFGPSSTEQIYRFGNTLRFYVNGADVSTLSSTGLAVTGAVSVTNNASVGTTSVYNSAGFGRTLSIYDSLSANVSLTNATAQYQVGVTGANLNTYKDGSLVTSLSSTGLAVTGSVSATGAISGSTAGVRLPTASPVYFNAGFTTYIQEVSAGVLQFVAGGVAGATLDASGNLLMTGGGSVGRTAAASGIFFNTNSVLPSTGTGATDNTVSVGSASYRWTTIYATTGAINTSDARAKTKVRTLADAEVEAAKAFSKEIGIFQWLDSVAKKGDKARKHVGFTVQRAIEIMEANGLDPMAYAFICHDVWADEFKEHPPIAAVEDKAAVLDEDGNVIEPAVEAVEGKDAWTEQIQTAGDRYAFRYDQLNLFIARGLEARLAALESA